MGTYSVKGSEIKRDWLLVDASDKVLGRLASEIAKRLRGKHKPSYTPHLDVGDHVIVINARKIKVTGNKQTDKEYHHYTGYQGGLKTITFDKLMEKDATRVLRIAVQGMLPKGSLGRSMLKKLKVYADTSHQHSAQQPKLVEF